MTDSGNESPVFAIVLAAGRSTRFDGNKMLAPVGGRPLVRHAAELAREVCGSRSVLVAGFHAAEVMTATGNAAGFVVINERHDEGMGTSIAAGVAAVRNTAGAVLILLADQPLVTVDHLAALISRWSGTDNEIVATAFDDTVGPPVLFPRGAFGELVRLEGDDGARRLIRSPFRVETVRFDNAAVDVDRPDDLENLTDRHSHQSEP